jgi:hypothetical protein
MSAGREGDAADDDVALWLATVPVLDDLTKGADDRAYVPLPEGWAMAVADVVSSGQAISAGRYKAVNMAAAGVITAVLNGQARMDLPFTFGGDGAAVAVPPDGIDAAREALARVAGWIASDIELTMRVALVPVAAIRAAGHDLRVARVRAATDTDGLGMAFALFTGGGSAWAEAELKAGRFAIPPAPVDSRPNLTGLSCRWNPVAARRGNILSLIAMPVAGTDPAQFQALVRDLVAIAAETPDHSRPLPADGPVPTLHFDGVEVEARATVPPGGRWMARMRIRLAILLTVFLHRTGCRLGAFHFRSYARDLATNSDSAKFDDGLKMTLDVDDRTLARIEDRLARARAAGICAFGLHRQDTALVTCMVPSVMGRDHVHFVDGADGGYAQAAVMLKSGGKEAA